MKTKHSGENSEEVELLEATCLSRHNLALLEAGKEMMLDSIKVGAEFCKFMISFCIGAIPIYLGLLKLFVVELSTLSYSLKMIAVIAVLLYLLATISFVLGYLPRAQEISLDTLNSIEVARDKTIQGRRRCIIMGLVFLFIGIALSVGGLLFFSA